MRAIVLLLIFGISFPVGQAMAQDVLAVKAAGRKLLRLQTKLAPPRPGDWLAGHRELGQTFDQYIAANPNRPNAQRTTIYLQPIGNFEGAQQRLLYDTVEMMRVFFGTRVETLEKMPLKVIPPQAMRLPAGAYGPQILTGYVLNEVLKPQRPRDAVAVLALTTADLWPGEGWNFVFGQASLRERVGVWSVARFGDPALDYAKTLRRTIATATHETGHMLGIPHCIAFECGMNGSNSLAESDGRRIGFCGECEQKIWWGCKVDPVKRHEALLDFMTRSGLEREAREWQRELDALKLKP